jgi:hypothetical protein
MKLYEFVKKQIFSYTHDMNRKYTIVSLSLLTVTFILGLIICATSGIVQKSQSKAAPVSSPIEIQEKTTFPDENQSLNHKETDIPDIHSTDAISTPLRPGNYNGSGELLLEGLNFPIVSITVENNQLFLEAANDNSFVYIQGQVDADVNEMSIIHVETSPDLKDLSELVRTEDIIRFERKEIPQGEEGKNPTLLLNITSEEGIYMKLQLQKL